MRTTEHVNLVRHRFACDKATCDKTELVEVPIGEDRDETIAPEGWILAEDPRPGVVERHLAFHSKRCAIGYFRDFVDEVRPVATRAAASTD